MERTRAYHRAQRRKAIARKKKICRQAYGYDYYQHDGKYSKGKIHCSCGMCRCRDHKGGHLLTKQEFISVQNMAEGLALYEEGILDIA